MYTITKQFAFSASHQLFNLPKDHQCARLHGHNYRIEVVLKSDILNKTGFIVDYGELKTLKDFLDKHVDHRHLNDVFDFNPTAENLARHLFRFCKDRWKQTCAVRVSETEKTWAEYAE